MSSNAPSSSDSGSTVAPAPTKTTRVRRAKTWSSFGNLGRKPSEYEIVTHNMNHTVGGPTPLEMGAEVHGNQWLKRHRDEIPLRVAKAAQFRDPDQLTYRKYTRAMDDQETYIDGLLLEYSVVRESDNALNSHALDLLASAFTPTRYLGHGLQMLSAYVQQLAHSSYMANCAAFQTADQLRRVQRVAYRTRQLALVHPSRKFGSSERTIWEKDADWQPTRAAVERLLVTYDWDQSFVGLNLVVKPLADELFLKAFSEMARLGGDELDALIADNLFLDAQRSRRWTIEACRAILEADSANRAVLQTHFATWRSSGIEIVKSGSRLLTRHLPDVNTQQIATRVNEGWAVFLEAAGLGGSL